jgi:hypothetical protein
MAIVLGVVIVAWLTLATDGSLDAAALAASVTVLLGLAVFDDGAGVEWTDIVCGQDAPQDHAEPLGQGNRGEG